MPAIQARERALEAAERAERIMREERYVISDGTVVDLASAIARAVAHTELVRPHDWPGIEEAARTDCALSPTAAEVVVTQETTLAALHRLTVTEDRDDVAALNFASARNPGGGWRTGALAQEETLARASCLVRSLLAAPDYYQANRAHRHLFYTEHAIWSESVPFFAGAEDELLSAPFLAHVLTMPAPNVGAMIQIDEADVRALPDLWRSRIGRVLALAASRRVRHLVLGAWGCGAFGNDPQSVAQRFREVLAPPQPWLRGFDSVTFAIHDTSRQRPSYPAFAAALMHLGG
jgi:uncharacterized protein (TIGR02452 family)